MIISGNYITEKLCEAITAAGVANKQPGEKPLRQLLDECVRYVAVGDVALQRRRVWITVEVLYRMRRLLLELYARTHQGERAHQAFEATADTALQARLGTTLPQYSLVSLQQSLLRVMDVLQSNIGEFSGGELQLADGHHKVLERVRQNQQELSSARFSKRSHQPCRLMHVSGCQSQDVGLEERHETT